MEPLFVEQAWRARTRVDQEALAEGQAPKELKGRNIWISGADEHATVELHQAKLDGPRALVLGAEGEGMRRLTRENCYELVRIPMLGGVESLNVSVSAGICLYEARRQRGFRK